jgi:uncharacterized protein (DUF302 family)
MPDDATPEIVTKHSSRSVGDVTARLTRLITSKGMKVFDVIDQRAEARRVGLDLRETIVVIFGNPAAGTPVMDAAPLAALDLPLKIVIWDDGTHTSVSYDAPHAIAARHGLEPELEAKISGIDGLTDTVVAE